MPARRHRAATRAPRGCSRPQADDIWAMPACQNPIMTGATIPAAAAGTWQLGDLTVNRMGFGAMRLTQRGPAFAGTAAPSDRSQAIAVLRRAVELGVNHIDTAAFYFS